MDRPIVTFTTDFGLSDSYVAEMKAAVLRENPHCHLIDATHLVPPQDVLAGGFVLQRLIASFPPGAIHVAVIDPGVGTGRRLLLVEIAGQRVICPDNGLITWAWRMQQGGKSYELTWRSEHFSDTFHGRDLMAPLAGMLSRGVSIKRLARCINDPMLLKIRPTTSNRGEVIRTDHFGNIITNIVGHLGGAHVRAGRKKIPIHRTYGAVPSGRPVALVGSSGLLEIAVRDGSAARALRLRLGQEVVVE